MVGEGGGGYVGFIGKALSLNNFFAWLMNLEAPSNFDNFFGCTPVTRFVGNMIL
jgi:hypothetical protein